MMARHTRFVQTPHFHVLIFGLIGFAGLIIILIVTPWGIGISHDSVYYLDAAENALAGRGLRWQGGSGELRPLTHYPPFYPLLLAGVSLFGFDFAESARVLAALLFALNLAWIAWLIYRHTHSWPTTLAAAILAIASPVLVDVHLMALTESLFIFLMLATITALTDYLDGGGKRLLVAAGALAGLANLTRYAGLSLTGTALLALILFGRAKRRVVSDILLFSSLALIPLLLWYARNLLLAGTPVGREILLHPPSLERLKLGLQALYSWLLPPSTPFLIANVIFAVVLIMFLLIFLRQTGARKSGVQSESDPGQGSNQLVRVALLYILTYAVFLMLSLSFVDASTPLDARILSPAYVTALLATTVVLWRESGANNTSLGRLALQMTIWILVMLSYVPQSWQLLNSIREEGWGFSARQWETSELITKVQEMEEDAIIYTSDALRLYYLTGRPVYQLPEKINPVKASPSEGYVSEMEIMRRDLKSPGSALVLFYDSFAVYHPELPKIEEVTEGLVLYWRTRHGVIYIDRINAQDAGD